MFKKSIFERQDGLFKMTSIETIPSIDDYESPREVRREDEVLLMEELVSDQRRKYIQGYDEEWIREHIKQRECSQFIEDPDKKQSSVYSERQCSCGYLFSEHSGVARKYVLEKGTKWDNMRHSETKPTNAFGNITFDGYDGLKDKPYVRLDVDTTMEDVRTLLLEVWKIKSPKLILSVTGGAKNDTVNRSLRDTLRHGLSKIIQTRGTWILAGGTHAGVPKHVGEAVKASGKASGMKNHGIAIGIAPWGCLQNKEALINDKQKGLNACYSIKKGRNNQVSLDPNYTHFLLVDDATPNEFGVEITFKAKLMNEIAQNFTKEGCVSLPSIQLVLAGDPDSLENVHLAMEKKTPTVIVKSSGLANDILAYAYLNSKEYKSEASDSAEIEQKRICRYLEESVKSKVENMIKCKFGENKTMTHLERICDCLEKSDLLSVYEIEGKRGVIDIDVAILQALFKANKYQVINQLRLALHWNRSDMAERVILTNDKKELTEDLYGVMFLALQQNRVNFVRLFLDQGLSLKLFLTRTRLYFLYQTEKNSLLDTFLLDNAEDPDELSWSDLGTLVRELLGDTIGSNLQYTRPCGLSGLYFGSKYGPSDQFEKPFQHLFIWSILMMYQDMAKLCWAEGEDAIAMALIAYTLLKSILMKTRDQENGNKLKASINEWSELAAGVLSECHSTDVRLTQDLLVREQSNWRNTSCMLLAGQTENKDFISQDACQSLINKIWYGELDHDTPRWRLLLCLICPFLACVLLDTNPSHRRVHASVFNQAYIFVTAPVVRFLYNFCSYLVFLSLYTYILVFNFDKQVSLGEIVLIIWVVALATEEVRQVVMNSSTTLAKKWHSYITDTWNKVDTLAIVVFIIGIILRFLPFGGTLEAARVVLALNFVTFFMRLLHIFSVHKELGPKLVMIGEMMHDLMYFLLILMVFVFSYAISSNSILYPNSSFTWNTVVQVIRKSYWNIYGELLLEEIEGEADCSYDAALWMNGTQARCPTETGKWLVPIMMGIYVIIANVLLLNLLIAMFSNTFQKVQSNSDTHWHYQRYSLINEYHTRRVLFPPFNLFAHIYLLFRFICESCCCKAMEKKHEETGNCFCRKIEDERKLTQWEIMIADTVHHRKRELENVPDLEHKVDIANNITETIKEQLEMKIPPRLDSRLTNIEKQLDSTQKSHELIISSLQYIKTEIENKPTEPVQKALSRKQSRVADPSE